MGEELTEMMEEELSYLKEMLKSGGLEQIKEMF